MNNWKPLNHIQDLADYLKDYFSPSNSSLHHAIIQAGLENPFFTKMEIERMILSICSNYLEKKQLQNWIDSFPTLHCNHNKVIGIIGAGNIPYVWFHDLWCCLALGLKIQFKASSKDLVLTKDLFEAINRFYTDHLQQISIVERLAHFDAVITTGGQQSRQVFASYFEKYPSIIRGHRNSIAILKGNESLQELKQLGEDVFSYFGLGCRNVHHLFVPENYNFNDLLGVFDSSFKYVKENYKYNNNYDYFLAAYLLSRTHFFQAESILLLESSKLHPPIGSLYFSYYKDQAHLEQIVNGFEGKLQCICSNDINLPFSVIPLGSSQYPVLNNYQDNQDTIAFLFSL